MTTADQDTIYQYQDGWDLLGAAVMVRGQLLRELEHLVKVPQEASRIESIAEFRVGTAQALLFELSVIGDDIATLIREINHYAERCGKPRVEVIEKKLH